MRILLPLLSVALLASSSALANEDPPTADDAPPTAHDVAAAGDLYASNCIACHPTPALQFAVDRAWLAQVADTA